MTEKILQTRIINKHADLATWKDSSLPLKTGEIALARVDTQKPDGHGGYYTVPTYLMKVGDGDKTFSQLEWLAAPASDVYEWAKSATKPGYTATEIARGASNVATDLKAAEDAIIALQTAIGGSGSVATMIQNAIQALDENTWAAEDGIKFVTAVGETDGKISVTRRALTAADIPALGIDKITGLQDALDAKAAKTYVDDQNAAIKTRLESGDIKQAIDAAKQAGDNAQAYAEGIYKVDGETKTGVLAEYMTSNDAALDTVRQTAEAAQTATQVSDAIDAKISNYNNTTIKALDERVVANNTAISAEKSRAEGVESGLDTRLITVEGKVDALSSATHFLGVKTELPATAAKGDIVIVGSKEYVYDPEATVTVEGTKWVELGDTTAEQARIKAVEDNVADILADLGEEGDTTKAIAAAQAQADKGVADAAIADGKAVAAQNDATQALADAKTANDAIAIINGTAAQEGSIAKAAADTLSAANTYAKNQADAAADKADAAQSAIDTHAGKQDNPHNVTAEQVGLGKVENKTVAEIKTEFTGAVADGNDKFVTGDAVYDAIEAAKTAANGYTDTEVKKVDDKAVANATDITTIKNTYARVKTTGSGGSAVHQLVVGQDANEMVIIFDCGGAE